MLEFPLWKKLLVAIVSVWGILYALPNLIPNLLPQDGPQWLPGKTANLGLDLQGGAHLLLEVQMAEVYQARLENAEQAIRIALRKQRIRAHSFAVNSEEDGTGGLSFSLANQDDLETVRQLINSYDEQLEVSSAQGGRLTLQFMEEARLDMRQNALDQSIEVVRRRIDEYGTSEPIIQRQGLERILVQVPGVRDAASLKSLLNTTARLTFHQVSRVVDQTQFQTMVVPVGQMALPSAENPSQMILLDQTSVVGGEALENAQSTFDQGQPAVNFTFDSVGAKAFGDYTAANVGERLAIVLDDQVISMPSIREPILTGTGMISGSFTVQTAENLAVLLRAGALPAPLTYIEERTVGPGLGADSIAAGQLAALIAMLGVCAFMILNYRWFGVYAVIALLVNLCLILAIITVLRVTLTLPGIAGLVLTVGIAVDANILIYQRIREEARQRSLPSNAIDTGYRRAFGTIIDSNLTTLIGSILLFSFGKGPIQGFALTLSIGILCSMFTAIMVTRFFVISWLRRTRPKTIPL